MSKKAGTTVRRIAILGAGPSGLFLYKQLVESGGKALEITIIERKAQIGAGMPYSAQGAGDEHITNVSGNEIPPLVQSLQEWVKTAPAELLNRFNIDPGQFSDYRVLPRLFFGEYLSSQFYSLLAKGERTGLTTLLKMGTSVTDIADHPEKGEVWVMTDAQETLRFHQVIICTGHIWPVKEEGVVPGYFDSPYPPNKLQLRLNHSVAIKGSSLTAMDAIRTLARQNGRFVKEGDQPLVFQPAASSPEFRIRLHSRTGLLPAVRFHLDDSHLRNDAVLTPEEIEAHIAANDGFLSLDFIFEQNFKELIRRKDPTFYEGIRHMKMEAFVTSMMDLREQIDPFVLLKAEYKEAATSIRRRESVHWKEMLGVLSFALNYPAKYLSAEDMQRLRDVLKPLISIVIAYMPQRSCEELMALHEAGVLDMVQVGEESNVTPGPGTGATYHYTDTAGREQAVHYRTFIDCSGQPALSYHEFPFKSMIAKRTVSPAYVRFRSAEKGEAAWRDGNKQVRAGENGRYYLAVDGIAINDSFQVTDAYGVGNNRIYIMAVPYIGGYNPDYSGLDFCQEAAARIVPCLLETPVETVPINNAI